MDTHLECHSLAVRIAKTQRLSDFTIERPYGVGLDECRQTDDTCYGTYAGNRGHLAQVRQTWCGMSGIKTTKRTGAEVQGDGKEAHREWEKIWIGRVKAKRGSAAIMSCGTPVIDVGPFLEASQRRMYYSPKTPRPDARGVSREALV